MAIKILSWVGPLHILAGLLLFLTAFVPDIQSSIAASAGLVDANYSPFLFAVLGPTVASWGILFTAVVRQFIDYPTRRLWNALVLAVAVWAPLDIGLCWYYGVNVGAVADGLVFLLLFVLLYNVRPRRK